MPCLVNVSTREGESMGTHVEFFNLHVIIYLAFTSLSRLVESS